MQNTESSFSLELEYFIYFSDKKSKSYLFHLLNKGGHPDPYRKTKAYIYLK